MTLQQEWENFEDKVITKEADEIQRAEMRMAFFAGALVATQALKNEENATSEFAINIMAEAMRYMRGVDNVEVYREAKKEAKHAKEQHSGKQHTDGGFS